MKATLPQMCTRYLIRNPVYHLHKVRHTCAEQSLRYCLIKHLTEDVYADLVYSTLFLSYKIVIKNKMINYYSAV